MKIALVTTTINVPKVLALYRALAADSIRFFVAADKKTPWEEAEPFCEALGNCDFIGIGRQAKYLNYKSSELIGWNTDSRRNIAVLEALKWGAELIISIDDDMIPVSPLFDDFEQRFIHPFSGLKLGAPGRWFDAGVCALPQTRQRGVPVDVEFDSTPGFATGAKIGAAQGIILGVPDTDASTAIASQPFIHTATDILRQGFVVEPKAHAVFNSQITAFRRELAPAFAQFYRWQGRNTDIIASLLMRRVMQDLDLYTYFGPPFGFHARAKRPLLNDLQAEMIGLRTIIEIQDYLDRMSSGEDVLATCRYFYGGCAALPSECSEAGLAWCEDVESVL